MPFRSSILIALAVALIAPGEPTMAQADPTNWRQVAAKIVNRMALVRGERVLLVGLPDVAGPLVPHLREAVRAAGAVDLGAVAEGAEPPGAWATDFTRDLARSAGTA